jgi:predicted GTPase
MTSKCRAGQGCTLKYCKFDHSTEIDPDKRSLIQRQASLITSTKKCNFGARCTNPNCPYSHEGVDQELQNSQKESEKKKQPKKVKAHPHEVTEITWRNYRPQLKKHLNILFFGASGTGKSSTINNFLTLASTKNNVIHKAAPRRNETEQMTKKFECYPVNSHIMLYDCWGWTRGANYNQGEFKKMLDGQLQVGHAMDSTKFASVVNHDNVVDALILVVDAKRALEEGTQFFNDFKQFAEEARRDDVVVIFAITKVDMLDGLRNVRAMPNASAARRAYNNDADFKTIRDKIKRVCPHEDIRVMPVINYEPEDNDKDEIMSGTVETILDYIVERVSAKKEVGEGKHAVFDLFLGEPVIEFQYDH